MPPTHQQGTDLEGHFAPFAAKMHRAGQPSATLRAFQYYYAQLVQGAPVTFAAQMHSLSPTFPLPAPWTAIARRALRPWSDWWSLNSTGV